MPNFNKCYLMGNLTRDIELRHTSGNQAVANLGLAINRRWKSADGQDREEVTYVDCEAWGRTAETLAKYLQKGRPVFIEGRLKLDTWEDKEGKKQSKIRVVVEGFQFIDSRPGGAGGGGGGQATSYEGSDEPRYESDSPRGGRGGSGGGRAPSAPPASDIDVPF
jgi:single-strand DNA-binding protein